MICTDIFLKVPEVQFPTPSTLPDLMNMIVVADKGIICEGTDAIPSTIQGSIYAGLLPGDGTTASDTSIQVGSNASLSIDSGDKIVCEGEINVNANPTIFQWKWCESLGEGSECRFSKKCQSPWQQLILQMTLRFPGKTTMSRLPEHTMDMVLWIQHWMRAAECRNKYKMRR